MFETYKDQILAIGSIANSINFQKDRSLYARVNNEAGNKGHQPRLACPKLQHFLAFVERDHQNYTFSFPTPLFLVHRFSPREDTHTAQKKIGFNFQMSFQTSHPK